MGVEQEEDNEPFDTGVFTKKKNTGTIKVKKTSSRY